MSGSAIARSAAARREDVSPRQLTPQQRTAIVECLARAIVDDLRIPTTSADQAQTAYSDPVERRRA